MWFGLKEAILKSGKSQRQISNEVCIPENRFSQIVCGWRSPSLDEQARIVAALGDLFPPHWNNVARLDAFLNERIIEAASDEESRDWFRVKREAKVTLAGLPDDAVDAAAATMLRELEREARNDVA